MHRFRRHVSHVDDNWLAPMGSARHDFHFQWFVLCHPGSNMNKPSTAAKATGAPPCIVIDQYGILSPLHNFGCAINPKVALLMEYQEYERNRRYKQKDRDKQQSPRLIGLLHVSGIVI